MVGKIRADEAGLGVEEPLDDRRDVPPEPPEGPPHDDDGPSGDPQEGAPRPPVANAYIGVAMFLGAEVMFFAGLIGAFLFFRYGSRVWPPPLQPRLPLGVTWINTGVLLLSALTMTRAWVACRGENREKLNRNLLLTLVLGVVFLAVQGSEWARLVRFGLTISSGVYGGIFYTLIGFHGLHVLGAVSWLAVIFFLVRRAPFGLRFRTRLEMCAIYWYFVVGLWPVLFVLVYLS